MELQNWLKAYFKEKETNKKHCSSDTIAASLNLFYRYCFGRCSLTSTKVMPVEESSWTGSSGANSLFSREDYSLLW